jgi:uncharacterized protein YbjT (DUF2867 family)
MTILVTGARGNIGGAVVATLARTGHHVRGSARDVATLSLPAGVEATELDLTNPRNAQAALRDVDAVFLYPARGAIDDFLQVARAMGVRYVVLLSSPAAYEAGEYDRVIGVAHRAVERSLADSGLPHTVLYPSWLATNARRDWAAQIRDRRRVGIAYQDAQVNPIHIEDVAEVAATRHRRHPGRGGSGRRAEPRTGHRATRTLVARGRPRRAAGYRSRRDPRTGAGQQHRRTDHRPPGPRFPGMGCCPSRRFRAEPMTDRPLHCRK